ncbi:LPS translocon maturation chaperone LptM [Xanthobacter sediminis]
MSRLTLPLALAAALALAACGVKGPLEPPPGAPQAPAPQAQVVVPPPSARNDGFHSAVSASDMASSATPHADWEKSQQNAAAAKADPLKDVARPSQPFILDGLL